MGRSPSAGAELTLALLQHDQVEIHLHPDEYALLATDRPRPGAPEAGTGPAQSGRLFLKAREANLYEALGVVLPRLVFARDANLRQGEIAVKANGRLLPAVPGPCAGELFVEATVGQLGGWAANARPLAHPAHDGPGAAIPAVAEENAKAAGLSTWRPEAFAAVAVQRELVQVADRLLSAEGVDYLLAQLQRTDPDAVQAVLARVEFEEITWVLRGLVAERVSIRDLRPILERLLHFDTIAPPADGSVVLDDRICVDEATSADLGLLQVEFARRGLTPYFASVLSGDGWMRAALTPSPEIEWRAIAHAAASQPNRDADEASDREREALRDAIWTTLRRRLAEGGPGPVLLTSPRARAPIRELIARELPDLPVLARCELWSSTEIQSVWIPSP